MTLVLTLALTTMSFAQKNEIKAIEKALKSSNFADAKSAVSAAEALMANMDDKTKAKFYFLKAKALYANGTATDSDIDLSIETINQLKNHEAKIGKLKYTAQANELTDAMFKSALEKANDSYTKKDYKSAAGKFEKVYKMSPKDTIYLYYAASSAVNAKDYETSLKYYNTLKDIGFTDIRMNYYATKKDTGEQELFGDKATRDFYIKAKSHNNPVDKKTESKRAEIVKNIALIYVSQGQDDKALAAMADARAENPDDFGLLLSEANVHLKLGNTDKFKTLMQEATLKDPNNPELQFNLGVLSSDAGEVDEALNYYNKAIEIDPKYVDAYINASVAILGGEQAIVEEMNNLGTSAADNRKYDELKEKRSDLYRSAIPYLEKALDLNKTNVDAAKTLMNIYSVLGEMDKFKEMKAKIQEIESAGN